MGNLDALVEVDLGRRSEWQPLEYRCDFDCKLGSKMALFVVARTLSGFRY